MSFDWREYLELAKDLISHKNNGYSAEAKERTVISRAYYAAFCYSRNFAKKTLGYVINNTPDEHKKLREFLRNKGYDKTAYNLNDLRIKRNNSDYTDSFEINSIMLNDIISKAERIFNEFKEKNPACN